MGLEEGRPPPSASCLTLWRRMPDSLTIQLPHSGVLPVTCPAGEPIAAVRRRHRLSGHAQKVDAEVPGVQCRIVHEALDLISDPQSPGLFCCHPDAGYRQCPIWQYDKTLIEHGMKSMGDEGVAEEENEQVWRDDLTGSRYGDTSFVDAIEQSAQAAVREMQDPDADGFIRGEAG